VPPSKPGSPAPLQVTLRHDVHTLIHKYFTNQKNLDIQEELEKRNHLRVRLEVFQKDTRTTEFLNALVAIPDHLATEHLSRWPLYLLDYPYTQALRIFQDNKPKLLDYLYNTEEPKRVFGYIPLALPIPDTYVVQIQHLEKKRNAIWIYQNYSGIFSVHWCKIPYDKVAIVFDVSNYGTKANFNLFLNNEGVSTDKNVLMDYLDENKAASLRAHVITTNLYLFVHIVFRSWDSPRHCTIQFGGTTLRCIDLHKHIRILKTYALCGDDELLHPYANKMNMDAASEVLGEDNALDGSIEEAKRYTLVALYCISIGYGIQCNSFTSYNRTFQCWLSMVQFYKAVWLVGIQNDEVVMSKTLVAELLMRMMSHAFQIPDSMPKFEPYKAGKRNYYEYLCTLYNTWMDNKVIPRSPGDSIVNIALWSPDRLEDAVEQVALDVQRIVQEKVRCI
jgi:hypothetical protein